MSFSWETKKETPDPHKPFLPQYNLLATAFSWTVWNFFIQTKRNKNYLRLLYEDWVEMPRYNNEKIMRFIDIVLPSNPFLLGVMPAFLRKSSYLNLGDLK